MTSLTSTSSGEQRPNESVSLGLRRVRSHDSVLQSSRDTSTQHHNTIAIPVVNLANDGLSAETAQPEADLIDPEESQVEIDLNTTFATSLVETLPMNLTNRVPPIMNPWG